MNQQLKVLFLLAAVVILQACESKTNNQQQEASQQISLSTENETDCPPDSIPAAQAQAMITEAQARIDVVNNSADEGAIIPYGAKLKRCELQEMLDTYGEDGEVWAMLGMKDGELEIVFQGKETETSPYKYFDFTTPCPRWCPE